MASGTVSTTRDGPAHAGLPRPIVDVVFTWSGAIGSEGGYRGVRWPGGVDLRVDVERRLVGPEFEHDQLVGVQGALKDFELLATGFLLHGAAAGGHGLGEFGTLPRLGVCGDDE